MAHGTGRAKGSSYERNAVAIAPPNGGASDSEAPLLKKFSTHQLPMATLELDEIKDTETNIALQPGQQSPLDLTDERLMEMIQERDPEGIAMLHDRYASLVKAMIMRVLHNDAESDD